jgi:hypothetical protein
LKKIAASRASPTGLSDARAMKVSIGTATMEREIPFDLTVKCFVRIAVNLQASTGCGISSY